MGFFLTKGEGTKCGRMTHSKKKLIFSDKETSTNVEETVRDIRQCQENSKQGQKKILKTTRTC
jgi:hypothetical protein